MAANIAIVDQTFRDAHQCLWATRMRTAHMVPVAERMDRIGFQRIEAIAAVQFDVCVRFLKEDAWERVRTLVPAIKEVIRDIPLELHSHCLTGVAPLVYLEGVKAGADCIHTSVAPLANGAAQPAMQSMVRNLRALGYQMNQDDALAD